MAAARMACCADADLADPNTLCLPVHGSPVPLTAWPSACKYLCLVPPLILLEHALRAHSYRLLMHCSDACGADLAVADPDIFSTLPPDGLDSPVEASRTPSLDLASTPLTNRGSLEGLSALPELAPFVPSLLVQVCLLGTLPSG